MQWPLTVLGVGSWAGELRMLEGHQTGDCLATENATEKNEYLERMEYTTFVLQILSLAYSSDISTIDVNIMFTHLTVIPL